MGFITGLASVQETLAAKKSGGDFEDRVKARWVSVDPDSSVKITPLQELDGGSPLFSEKNGVAKFYLEHSHPDDFKKKAQCTADEGSCYGCDQGWYQKVVLYINVLVDNGKEDPFVAVWSRGVGKNSVAKQLLEIAADEDFGNSVTDKSFKLSRTGKGNDSSYTLAQLPKPLVKNVEDHEVYDLSKVVFYVSPDRQEAYYNGGEKPAAEKKSAPVSPASVDADW